MTDRRPLGADETELEGAWVEADGEVIADDVERRISWLVETQLEHVADSDDGWSTVLRDPQDGRLWALTFPQSEMHGGGPRRLAVMREGGGDG